MCVFVCRSCSRTSTITRPIFVYKLSIQLRHSQSNRSGRRYLRIRVTKFVRMKINHIVSHIRTNYSPFNDTLGREGRQQQQQNTRKIWNQTWMVFNCSRLFDNKKMCWFFGETCEMTDRITGNNGLQRSITLVCKVWQWITIECNAHSAFFPRGNCENKTPTTDEREKKLFILTVKFYCLNGKPSHPFHSANLNIALRWWQ